MKLVNARLQVFPRQAFPSQAAQLSYTARLVWGFMQFQSRLQAGSLVQVLWSAVLLCYWLLSCRSGQPAGSPASRSAWHNIRHHR